MPKIMVIGLDGGTFDVLDPMMKKGLMPNLQKIIEAGGRTDLISTVPPITAPAWASFWTGKNPGNHGIYNFARKVSPRHDNFETEFINAGQMASYTLLDVLNQAGKKTICINVPLTYPPPKINGILISGMLTPNTETDFTYPASFKEKLLGNITDYTMAVEWTRYKEREVQKLVDDLIKTAASRVRAAELAMQELDWDAFFLVFSSIDVIQHCLWYSIDEGCPQHARPRWNRHRDKIAAFYARLDDCIGELLKHADRHTSVFVISDHGFGPTHKHVSINKLLADKGLLKYRQSLPQRMVSKIISKINIIKDINPQENIHKLPSQYYDFSRTKAYFISKFLPGVFLACDPQSREYADLRESIITELQQLKDLESGEAVFKKVFKREEVYQGKFLNYAPDIVYLANRGYFVFAPEITPAVLSRLNAWGCGRGHHLENGIFMAAGNNIKPHFQRERASITDIAPTLLYALGLPVPGDMDGKVILDAFAEGYIKNNPLKTSAPPPGRQRPQQEGKKEEDEIKARLEGLGYL